jgi:hypothetical protein
VWGDLVNAARRQTLRGRRPWFERPGLPEEEEKQPDWEWDDPVRGELVNAARRLEFRGQRPRIGFMLGSPFEPEAPVPPPPPPPPIPRRPVSAYVQFEDFNRVGRKHRRPRS